MTEFLRMSGIYWGVTALDIMDNLDKIDQNSIVEFIKKCQCPISGGISPCEGHDPHMLYTLSAVQVIIGNDLSLAVVYYHWCTTSFVLTHFLNLCTLFVQILCIYDRLHEIDLESVAKYVSGLQQLDGSFFGDRWGEVDIRFSFCAVAILTLIVSEVVSHFELFLSRLHFLKFFFKSLVIIKVVFY